MRAAKALEAKYGDLDKLNAKENPMALMEKFGITVDDIIQYQLKSGQPPKPEDKLQTVEQKLAALEEKLKTDAEASKQQSIDRAVQGFKNQIKAHTDTDLGKYELINAHDAHDMVFKRCEDFWSAQEDVPADQRKHLDIATACDQVENELFEYSKSKFANVSKYKTLFAPQPDPTAPDIETKAKDTPKPQTEPTLTNRGNTPSASSSKLLPREKAIAQIAAQFNAKL